MASQKAATVPELKEERFEISVTKQMAVAPATIYQAFTTPAIERWFAQSGTALMAPTVDAAFFFETEFDGGRHPHYGRFVELIENRLVRMTWLTELGTAGAETVLTLELTPSGGGTRVVLTHQGFLDETMAERHKDAWPEALSLLDSASRSAF